MLNQYRKIDSQIKTIWESYKAGVKTRYATKAAISMLCDLYGEKRVAARAEKLKIY